MDYKKFRDVNAWLNFIGTELSAVLSIVMMFFPEEHVSINFTPVALSSIITSARTVWLTSQKGLQCGGICQKCFRAGVE